MFAALQENAIAVGQFAMKLIPEGSELYIGGINPELYHGEIDFHPTDSKQGAYVLVGAAVFVGDQRVMLNVSTFID